MNVSTTVRFDDHAFINCCAVRDALSISAEPSDSAVSVNTCRENKDAVHLNGQGPRKWDSSAEGTRLRLDSLAVLNLPAAEKEPSASLQANGGPGKWSRRSMGVRRTFAAAKDLIHALLPQF